VTRRDMDHFIRQLRREGFTATVTGKSHWRVTHPDMTAPVFAAGSPSDRRALLNLRATIRRCLTTPIYPSPLRGPIRCPPEP
jgi:hypothetical protein